MTEPISVVIADDHGVVRAGLRAMLEREGMTVLAEAETGTQAIEVAGQHRPAVVLLDIRMPDLDGLQALAGIKAACPETSVIMLTSYANPQYLARALSDGAAGFLAKDVDPERIPAAVRAAATGEHLVDPELLRAALSLAVKESTFIPQESDTLLDELSAAETRVLRLIAHGLNNDAIATSLSISINTVKTHVSRILEKLQVSDRTQAALWAVRRGLS